MTVDEARIKAIEPEPWKLAILVVRSR